MLPSRLPPVAWSTSATTPANDGVDAEVPPISMTIGAPPAPVQSVMPGL